jgi:Dolichyl-phosphate-mannose-protein mannosyltransferase
MKLPSAARLQRIELLLAVVLTLGLIGLHCMALFSAGPLWRDEISSLTLATKPTWGEVWSTLVYDPFPALFFTTLRAWHALFGGSDIALRILGCVIGVICLAGFWISARWTNRRPPLLALAFLGLSPTLIVWGDSLRPYGLAVFAILLAFGGFWVAINKPRPVYVLLATATAILAAQAIFTNAPLLLACGLSAAVVAARRRQWARALVALGIGAVPALSLLPYAGVLRATTEWAEIRKAPLPITAHFEVLREALLNAGSGTVWLWITASLIAIAVALISQIRPNSGELTRDLRLYAICTALFGFVATLAFFQRLQWPSNIWYFLPMLGLAAIAIDRILDSDSASRGGIILRLILSVACVVSSVGAAFTKVQVRASNLDLIASVLEKHAAKEDLIVIYPFVDAITFSRYFRGPTPFETIPKIEDVSLHRWDQLVQQARQENAIAPLLNRVNETLRSGHQVWVATTFPLNARAGPAPPVQPLRDPARQRIGYFLGGWGEQFVANLRTHAERSGPVNVTIDQPVSRYERSRLFVFSGWKDSAPENR